LTYLSPFESRATHARLKRKRAVARLDRHLDSPIQRRLVAWQERAFPGLDKYHTVRLTREQIAAKYRDVPEPFEFETM
jgi:hypothetical protein